MAMCSAVIDFNEGKLEICQIVKELGLECGRFVVNLAIAADKSSVKGIIRKSSEKGKKKGKN